MSAQRLHIQHPFWPVTTVSGLLGVLALLFLLGLFALNRDRSSLALAGLAGLVVAAHILGRRLAGERERFDLGIWVIAAAQILSAALAPLFLSEFWLLGALLLALVPVEVGVADQVKRMPLFVVFSLLGAAAMVAIDLLDLPGRQGVFSGFPRAIYLGAAFLALHLAGLFTLLWKLRLKPGASHYTRLDLATQQTLVFTGISSAAILLVTGVLILQLRAFQMDPSRLVLGRAGGLNAGQAAGDQGAPAGDSQAEVLEGVARSTKVAGLAGLLAMTLVVAAAIAMARLITRPIEALTRTAAAISAGDLGQCAQPAGPVEMVTLAEAFNMLTARQRELIAGLQDQVNQRTAQLEARASQLASLNRITQQVASVHDLQAALEVVSREMVQLFQARSCAIALLNEFGTELTIVTDFSLDANEPSTIGSQVPVAKNTPTDRVITLGRSLVTSQAQTGSAAGPGDSTQGGRGARSLMIVPLLARGEVIGTIGLSSSTFDREFTHGEVRLAETIAGQIAGALESARLFTEMEKAKEAAEAANQSKSAFLANISHELRTPLTSVLGFARLIQKRLEERILPQVQADDRKVQRAVEQVRENIQIILVEGERLTTLINNVLDLAKIEAGKVEWHMQPLDLAEIIARASAATTALFEQKGLQLILEIPEGLPKINGDRDRLIQVMINLISNAVKFTPHGTVTCRAGLEGEDVVVIVVDTGIGIDEADQPKVFEKFMQAGDTLTDKPQGTGLGLSICKEIIEAHGGRIWVESKPGQGSTFSFVLPVRARVFEPAPEARPAISLRFPAELDRLAAIRSFIEEAANRFQVEPDAVDDMLLAVDEAATNIIVHGYRGQPGAIEIEVEKQDGSLAVSLRDQAPPFDPTTVPVPDLSLPLDQRPFGGMGVYLMRQSMDEVIYRVSPQGGNELILVKKTGTKNSS
jgi:signal transduction histidine kinase